jgi:molecular chaperone DnaK
MYAAGQDDAGAGDGGGADDAGGGSAGASQDDQVVDADFEEVDDDRRDKSA